MSDRPYLLAESTWDTVRSTKYDVAVLPWGATEAHNRHLPYGTDNFESEAIAAESARRAWTAGARVVVLPTVPFGVNTGQREIPFCLNMNPSTQLALLRDVTASLTSSGTAKLVILNGHGGNDFRQMIRELTPAAGVLICQVDWYRCVPPAGYFAEPGDHAGELETSVMMKIAPSLVEPLVKAGPGRARQFRIRAFREGWAWTPRHWIELTDDTGVGDPAAAMLEKGERYVDAVAEKIAGFLCELAAADPTQLYE